jgi:hypothetical protein
MTERALKKRTGKTTIQVSDENLARLDLIAEFLELEYEIYYRKTRSGKASRDDAISWLSGLARLTGALRTNPVFSVNTFMDSARAAGEVIQEEENKKNEP